MKYICSSCETTAEGIVSKQGGRRHEFIPEGWSEVSFRVPSEGRIRQALYCENDTKIVKRVLLGGPLTLSETDVDG